MKKSYPRHLAVVFLSLTLGFSFAALADSESPISSQSEVSQEASQPKASQPAKIEKKHVGHAGKKAKSQAKKGKELNPNDPAASPSPVSPSSSGPVSGQ